MDHLIIRRLANPLHLADICQIENAYDGADAILWNGTLHTRGGHMVPSDSEDCTLDALLAGRGMAKDPYQEGRTLVAGRWVQGVAGGPYRVNGTLVAGSSGEEVDKSYKHEFQHLRDHKWFWVS